MPTLGAEVTFEGLDEASESVTSLGKAIESLEPIAEKMGQILKNMEGALTRLTTEVDTQQKQLNEMAEKSQGKNQADQEEKAQKERELEERRLKAKVASMVGGGVNTAQYE